MSSTIFVLLIAVLFRVGPDLVPQAGVVAAFTDKETCLEAAKEADKEIEKAAMVEPNLTSYTFRCIEIPLERQPKKEKL